jgi:hypothetical protein
MQGFGQLAKALHRLGLRFAQAGHLLADVLYQCRVVE